MAEGVGEAPAGLVPGWEGMPKPASPGAWSACGARGGDGPTGPSAEAGGGVCVWFSTSSISLQLHGVGLTSAPFNSWKLGLPKPHSAKRTEPSCALTTKPHCLLRAGSGHPAVGPDLGPGPASCPQPQHSPWTLQVDFPTSQVWAGTAWGQPSPAGGAQLFLQLSYEKGLLRPRPRAPLSEAKLRAGECQHRRHPTWHLVPAGDPSELRGSEKWANIVSPSHPAVTSSHV